MVKMRIDAGKPAVRDEPIHERWQLGAEIRGERRNGSIEEVESDVYLFGE